VKPNAGNSLKTPPAVPAKVSARLEKLAAITRRATEQAGDKVDAFEELVPRLRSMNATLVTTSTWPHANWPKVLTVKATGMKTVEKLRENLAHLMPHVLHQVVELGRRPQADSFRMNPVASVKAEPYKGVDAEEAQRLLLKPILELGGEEIEVEAARTKEIVNVVPADSTAFRILADHLAALDLPHRILPPRK